MTAPGTDRRGRRVGLSRAAIVTAAVEVLDRDGLGGCTMRRVADHLNVHVMSLYNHIDDKSELLDAVAEAVLAEIEIPDTELPWDQQLRALAFSLRAAVLHHPHAAGIVISRPLSSYDSLRPVESTLGALRSAGLRPRDAVSAFWMFTAYVGGSLLSEAAAAVEHREVSIGPSSVALDPVLLPNLTEMAQLIADSDYESEFERGLQRLMSRIGSDVTR